MFCANSWLVHGSACEIIAAMPHDSLRKVHFDAYSSQTLVRIAIGAIRVNAGPVYLFQNIDTYTTLLDNALGSGPSGWLIRHT